MGWKLALPTPLTCGTCCEESVLDHANVGPAYERIYNGVPVLSGPDGTDKGEALNCDV